MSGKTRPGAGQGRRTGHGDSHDPVPETPRERQLILVVEDDQDDWEIYGKLLWYNGFDVIYARDGTEGLELARALGTPVVTLFGPTDHRWTTLEHVKEHVLTAEPFLTEDLVANDAPDCTGFKVFASPYLTRLPEVW